MIKPPSSPNEISTHIFFRGFADFRKLLEKLIPLRDPSWFVSRLVGDFEILYQPQKMTPVQRREALEALRKRLDDETAEVSASLREFEGFLQQGREHNDLVGWRETHSQMMAWAAGRFLEEGSVIGLQERLTEFRRILTTALIHKAGEEMASEGFGLPPTPYVWMALGSDGRREQLFATDQDNLLVYEATEESQEKLKNLPEQCLVRLLRFDRGEMISQVDRIDLTGRYFWRFCQKMEDFLDAVGINRCKGHIMPAYDKWRGTLSRWERRLIGKVKYGAGDLSILDMNILMDARYVTGDHRLAEKFRDLLQTYLPQNPDILNQIAHSAILMPVALGMFKRLKVKKSGPEKGTLNLKLNGWAPLTILVRVLCVKHRLFETHTLRRLDLLLSHQLLDEKIVLELKEAYYHMILFRALYQMHGLAAGTPGGNAIDPSWLDEEGQAILRRSLSAVESLQNQINRSFFGGTV